MISKITLFIVCACDRTDWTGRIEKVCGGVGTGCEKPALSAERIYGSHHSRLKRPPRGGQAAARQGSKRQPDGHGACVRVKACARSLLCPLCECARVRVCARACTRRCAPMRVCGLVAWSGGHFSLPPSIPISPPLSISPSLPHSYPPLPSQYISIYIYIYILSGRMDRVHVGSPERPSRGGPAAA